MYNWEKDLYDFAVLVLDKEVKYNQFVAPIALPNMRRAPGSNCKIAGWQVVRQKGDSNDNIDCSSNRRRSSSN